MSAHTPGDWHWDSDPIKGDPLGRFRCRVVTVGKTITQCYYSSDDKHAEADARLIAAAPEMLSALKNGEELLRIICEVICVDNPPPHGTERLSAMRAAIRKATGEPA